jgi:transcriptional regulator with GAF, ATPase, and Fis domain
MQKPTTLAETAQPDDEGLSPPDRPVPTLRLLYGKTLGIVTPARARLRAQPTSWRLRPGELQIGRGVPVDEVCLADDSQVSRLHATVTYSGRTGDRPLLRDLGSSNGCFVNGVRRREAELSDGDVLRVGSSLLLLRHEPDGLHSADAKIDTLIGQSVAIRRLRHEIALWGPSHCTVLLLGDSGTGKEVTAQALHTLSGVRGPLVAVNCAAIPETLAESQLFGHQSGAFTGAKAHPGCFRAASNGTLFLDEVGELPASLQPKLLRALEEGVITPVGSVEPQPCKVRVIAATNRNLPSDVQSGKLRGDLYARLSEIVIRLPPLRDRREDVLLLVAHFLGDGPPLQPALAEALVLYDWPWNVRELSKVTTELRVRGAKLPQLTLELIADRLRPPEPAQALPATQALPSAPVAPAAAASPVPPAQGAAPPAEPTPLRRDELLVELQRHGGRVAQVARALGRSRQQIYRAMEQHGLSIRDFRPENSDDNQDPP